MTTFIALLGLLAQLATGPEAPAAEPAALEAMARGILAGVEQMRGQKLSKPLKMGVKNREQVTAFIRERLDDEYGPEKVAAEGRLFGLQGLLPPKLDYARFVTALLTEQVAGFYDHTRQELHIADWLPALMQGPVMAHEIFHAIQDQEWDGGKLIDSKKYTHDSVLAHAALLEGDATVVMFNYQQREVDPEADMSLSPFMVNLIATSLPMQMSSAQFPVMASAPDYLKQSLIFPYQQGLLFVAALRQAGQSWDQIRAVYADPPHTTEQILHPERYLKRDEPSEVTLPAAVLPGFKRTWDGTTGEFHARQLLLMALPIAEAVEGAAGWDGDFTVLEVSGDKAVAVTLSTWDTEADATAFEAALNKVHGKRAAPKPTLVTTRRGADLAYAFSDDADLAKQAVARVLADGHVVRK
ncbi:MAG: hypothetical protein KC620_02840 [Myxococcales bacterium]|nr:hypothetical protein [Myxococcales bacterium]